LVGGLVRGAGSTPAGGIFVALKLKVKK